jgi:cysteine peptidase C11 family protein
MPVKTRIQRPTTNRPISEWTVGVYMVGGPELGPSIARDLLELETAGSSPEVNVVVGHQHRPASGATWWEILPRNGDGPGRRKKIGSSRRAQPARSEPSSSRRHSRVIANLTEFLDLLGTEYKARRYLIMLWGHASGLGFGGLRPGSDGDQARLSELTNVLRTLRAHRVSNGDITNGKGKLEILGFCACAVNKADYALELRNEVEYLIASQVGISTLMTWPFDETVKLLLMSPSVETPSLARQLVQCFEAAYEPPPVAMTALHLTKSEGVGKQIDDLSGAILTALDRPGDRGRLNSMLVVQAFDEALDAYPWEFEALIDLFDFCRKLAQKPLLEDPVRERARDILDQGFRSFVVQNARSGPKFGSLNGLSMLAPDFDDDEWLTRFESCCATPKTSYVWRETRWAEVTKKAYTFFTANKDLFE